MSILDELTTTKKHPCKNTFDQFPLGAVAFKLGIGPSYLSNIMNGSKTCGAELDSRIHALADLIEAEKAKSEK